MKFIGRVDVFKAIKLINNESKVILLTGFSTFRIRFYLTTWCRCLCSKTS